MSAYKHKLDIVSRTKEILMREHEVKYDKTLLLNCSLGLLIIPQQEGKNNKAIEVDEVASYAIWGIDPSNIRPNNCSIISEIARHIRNSLAHGRFDIVDCNGDSLERIHIRDGIWENNGFRETFDTTLSFTDYKRFVLKYAEELEKTQLDVETNMLCVMR